MPVSWLGAGASLLGGLFSGNANRDAAQTNANAQLESSRLAAEAAKFRPVGITTRFGQSGFQFDPNTGYLTGANYSLSPEMTGYQNRLGMLANQGLTQAEQAQQQYQPLNTAGQSLFNLGSQYLAQSPQQVAQQYMTQQQDLLAPSRERQLAELRNNQFQTGRGGLSVGATGLRPSGGLGLNATNPETEAYYNAIAQQDAQLAANANQAGQQNVAFGAGLFGTGANLYDLNQQRQVGALSPFQSYLNATQGIETVGQQPLSLGASLGGNAATAGANVGQSLLYGGLAANKTLASAPSSNLGNWGTLLTSAANSPYLKDAVQNGGFGGGADSYFGKSSSWGFDPSKLFNF
jgi:hypothetical protein